MTREDALRRLRDHEPELRLAGVRALYLFGSTARDQAGPKSDVDVACDLDDARGLSLLDFIGVKLRLSDLLGTEVDLVQREALRPRVRARVDADLVRVF